MRTDALHQYLSAKHTLFQQLVKGDPALNLFVQALEGVNRDDIDRSLMDTTGSGNRDFQTDPVLQRALGLIPAASALHNPLSQMTDWLVWFAVFSGPEAPQALSEFMHAAAIAYHPHSEGRPGLHTGLFLLHPHLDYPLHTHLADEVYYCVSGSVTIRHGVAGRSYALSAGDYSVTPSEGLHSLHTGDEPVLLSYVWSGELDAPNWWWHQDDTGKWFREHWQWDDNADWRFCGSEPVTDEIMIRANP